jgi:putative ABC transport system permease protein
MLKSYLHTALRNFLRNPAISSINLLGLSLGLASCLVATLYIKHELETDRFHQDLAHIYRVTVKLKSYDMSGTPFMFTEVVEKDFPEVQSTVRTAELETNLRIGEENFNANVLFADPGFFSFFTFDLKSGDKATALSSLNNIVLSEESAARYFPSDDPRGKLVRIKLNNRFEDFQVAGVAAQPSLPSSIAFDFLIPLENKYPGGKGKDEWGNFMLTSFVRVAPEKLHDLEAKMPALVDKYLQDRKAGVDSMRFIFNSFETHHLNNGYSGAGLKEGTSAQNLYVFAGIAVIILLLAAFNFMNLTNAQTSRRSTEVGIRKVVGAVKAQLIKQFLSEALFVSLLAAFIALGIAELCLIIFKDLLGVHLTVFHGKHVDVYGILVVVTLVTGLLSGLYPSIILSNLTTLKTFRTHFRVGGNNLLTRAVLGFQFLLSIVLMVGALSMWEQQKFMMNKDLGFNKEQLLVIPVPVSDSLRLDIMKTELKREPEIVNVSKTSGAFTRGNAVSIATLPDGSRGFIYMESIDEDYLETMAIKLLKGRNFAESDKGKSTRIIVNEALLKKFNLEDSVGLEIGGTLGWANNPMIIGVVRDFHHNALRSKIEPLMMMYNSPFADSYLMIRVAPGKITAALDKARETWGRHNADSPFDYFFLDEDLGRQYASEQRWSGIITVATGMAIFLSVLGLIGLALYTTEQRKKEIGIRKVLGASIRQLLGLLSKDYILLIGLAFVVATPVSYHLITRYWLNNFAYHIELNASIYLIALAGIMLIAITAVASQTIRSALQNPTNVLKEE